MKWGEPETPNGIVRQYMISYNLSGSDVITLTGTVRTVTIGDLLPFTFYEFTVVAFTIETGPGASDIVRTEEAGLCVYTLKQLFRLDFNFILIQVSELSQRVHMLMYNVCTTINYKLYTITFPGRDC